MKISPKEVLVSIPIVLLFLDYHEIPAFASNINQILPGKVKLKYEELGVLGEQYVGLFYFKRDDEFFYLRTQFKTAIEQEEIDNYNLKS